MESNHTTLRTRADVELLVRTFYGQVRQDELIGPIFNQTIRSEADWETHFAKLTDFWETNLFYERKYRGNPMAIHRQVDERFNHTLEEAHFKRWLTLWTKTVDNLYVGGKAQEAVLRAESIGPLMLAKIRAMRPTTP